MKALLIFPILVLAVLVTPALAAGTLHFKPDSNATVPANHFLAVNGTSAPSNTTRTHCTVMFQTNGHGYMPVKPDANGTYTRWSTSTSEMIKPGVNVLEGQIACFPPGAVVNATGNATGANFVHHLVHNVTGQ